MSRAEKKTSTPHLQSMKPASALPGEDGTTAPAEPTLGPKAKSEEVVTARRRTFTAEFKREVVAAADACTKPGELGALLRRHALYSSHLTEWRRLRDEGALAGLGARQRGRKPAVVNPLAAENARLEREVKRLTARAERAEGLVAVQKKLAELLGEELPSEEELLKAERRGLPIPPSRKKR